MQETGTTGSAGRSWTKLQLDRRLRRQVWALLLLLFLLSLVLFLLLSLCFLLLLEHFECILGLSHELPKLA